MCRRQSSADAREGVDRRIGDGGRGQAAERIGVERGGVVIVGGVAGLAAVRIGSGHRVVGVVRGVIVGGRVRAGVCCGCGGLGHGRVVGSGIASVVDARQGESAVPVGIVVTDSVVTGRAVLRVGRPQIGVGRRRSGVVRIVLSRLIVVGGGLFSHASGCLAAFLGIVDDGSVVGGVGTTISGAMRLLVEDVLGRAFLVARGRSDMTGVIVLGILLFTTGIRGTAEVAFCNTLALDRFLALFLVGMSGAVFHGRLALFLVGIRRAILDRRLALGHLGIRRAVLDRRLRRKRRLRLFRGGRRVMAVALGRRVVHRDRRRRSSKLRVGASATEPVEVVGGKFTVNYLFQSLRTRVVQADRAGRIYLAATVGCGTVSVERVTVPLNRRGELDVGPVLRIHQVGVGCVGAFPQ